MKIARPFFILVTLILVTVHPIFSQIKETKLSSAPSNVTIHLKGAELVQSVKFGIEIKHPGSMEVQIDKVRQVVSPRYF